MSEEGYIIPHFIFGREYGSRVAASCRIYVDICLEDHHHLGLAQRALQLTEFTVH